MCQRKLEDGVVNVKKNFPTWSTRITGIERETCCSRNDQDLVAVTDMNMVRSSNRRQIFLVGGTSDDESGSGDRGEHG